MKASDLMKSSLLHNALILPKTVHMLHYTAADYRQDYTHSGPLAVQLQFHLF